MHSSHLLLEKPIRMPPSWRAIQSGFFPALTKIVGTLGPRSRSVEVISACLKTGMSVARFDFSWGDAEYHQETLENLKTAIKSSKKLCALCSILSALKCKLLIKVTPDQGQEASSEVLPINFAGLAKSVKKGDTIFVGQYLFTGSETTSVWLEVSEVKGDDVVCAIKNSATLAGSLFTLHASQVHIDLPTLTDQRPRIPSRSKRTQSRYVCAPIAYWFATQIAEKRRSPEDGVAT
ncbi:hypothetical protein OROMI_002084 [Orobanche minor]